VGLLEQMLAVEALVRRPDQLTALSAGDGEDAQVLATIDEARLEAVAITFANLALGRWWRPRFPATLSAIEDPLALARQLVASPWFERAEGEDLTGVVLVQGLLDALEQGLTAAPPTRDLLAYEYLLEVGLPRRAAGEAIDAGAEARLLENHVEWLSGGRLTLPVVACRFEFPVSALRAGEDAAETPEGILFLLDPEGATELEVDGIVVDALELLAQEADDASLHAAFDDEAEAEALLAWLRELGVIAA